jgi:hypothetical protein
MTEHKTPRDRLLDLLVFGPAGLAMTAAEEFPKLVEKGRHRVEGQVHTARLVGQFAVQMGRKQLEDTVGGFLSGRRPPVPPAPAAPAAPAAAPAAPAAAPAAPTAAATVPAPPAAPPTPTATTASSVNGTMASDALAIPGYDSLSASQVVQRLGGLSAGELEAVREHEEAHRHRRTILNRVEQLLAQAGTPPA